MYTDYSFNEAFLGMTYKNPTFDGAKRLMGQVVKVHRPSEVIVMGDGGNGGALWWNYFPAPTSLADAYYNRSNAGYYSGFAPARHNLRMNFLFVDGHADTRLMKQGNSATGGDLDRTYLALD